MSNRLGFPPCCGFANFNKETDRREVVCGEDQDDSRRFCGSCSPTQAVRLEWDAQMPGSPGTTLYYWLANFTTEKDRGDPYNEAMKRVGELVATPKTEKHPALRGIPARQPP